MNGDAVLDHIHISESDTYSHTNSDTQSAIHRAVQLPHLSSKSRFTDSESNARDLDERGSEEESESVAVGLPACYALVVSGLPPREQLFNASICSKFGAFHVRILSYMKMNIFICCVCVFLFFLCV